MKLYILLLLVSFFCACSNSTSPSLERTNQAQVGTINEAQAIAVAEKVAREKRPKSKDLKSEATLKDGEWDVFIQFVAGYDDKGNPLVLPGGHCSVVLDRKGNVLHYYPGE